MSDFYGPDLAAIHAEAFERLAAAAAETLLKNLSQRAASGRVLDLGCGSGPLCRRVVGKGFAAWGLDISPALIALARERMPRGEFHCGSALDAELPPAVAVAAVGEALNYATARDSSDLGRMFRRVFDALEPGGVFLFDLAGPGRAGAGSSFVESPSWAVGVAATESDDWLVRRITTFRDVGCGAWRRSFETHRLRLWPAARVLAQLAACGFRAEELPGYDGFTMPPSLHAYLAVKPN